MSLLMAKSFSHFVETLGFMHGFETFMSLLVEFGDDFISANA